MKSILVITGMAVAAVASMLHAASIYTWQDENGQVHFSDRALEGVEKSKPVDIPGDYAGTNTERAADPYSIRQQIEYFDRKKEARRQARLEQQQLQQAAREQDLKEQELQYLQEQVDDSYPGYHWPYYRPYRRFHRPRPRHHRPAIRSTSPYAQQYLRRDKSNEFSTHTGSPYPSYPLNFWKY